MQQPVRKVRKNDERDPTDYWFPFGQEPNARASKCAYRNKEARCEGPNLGNVEVELKSGKGRTQ